MDNHLELPVTRLDARPTAEKIQKVQKELDEVSQCLKWSPAKVKEIVRNNIDLVIQRDGRLDALNARADVMEAGAAQFTLHATNLQRNLWWKNARKMLAVIAACTLTIIGAVRQDAFNREVCRREISS
ncbi:Vesicle-associated membrane protein 1 [Toxocara canis]|uniref:Vesicle-associated membrane protein 1 n=1 Tax=Toxocara canis TaxID=6265 RepID=A0A0B2W4Z8_TOXCA|nr:Vesicle-associated membrane protein 1 [Toxocara canis]